MKLPDLTLEEARGLVDDTEALVTRLDGVGALDPDYVMLNLAYRQGIQTARADFLSALESAGAIYRDVTSGKEIRYDLSKTLLDDLRTYVLSGKSLRDWYDEAD